MESLILSWAGRYSDPWHPFPETSAAIGALLISRGHDVEIRGDVEQAFRSGPSADLPELIFVNIGLPRDGSPVPDAATVRDGLSRLLGSTVPLLALHVSSTRFVDAPEWPALLGGRWVRGVSMHPNFGRAQVRVTGADHPITQGITDFELDDERYSWLEVAPASQIFAAHEHEGQEHPLIWGLERVNGGRTVYDALGHTAASYDSPTHRALLTAHFPG